MADTDRPPMTRPEFAKRAFLVAVIAVLRVRAARRRGGPGKGDGHS